MPQVLQLSLQGPQSEQHSSHDPQFKQHSKQFPHELVQEPTQQPLPGAGVGVGVGSGFVGSEPEVEPPLPHESSSLSSRAVSNNDHHNSRGTQTHPQHGVFSQQLLQMPQFAQHAHGQLAQHSSQHDGGGEPHPPPLPPDIRIVPEPDAPQCQCQRPKLSNASLQRSGDAHKTTLTGPAEDSDSSRITDAKDPSGQSPAPAIVGDSESERVPALEARLDFLRELQVHVHSEQRLALAEGRLARAAERGSRHTEDSARCYSPDTTCSLILADKNEELAALKGQLAAVQQSIATITTDRDEAHAHVATIADAVEKTHAEYYGEKVFSLKTRAIDVERSSATLQAMGQRQKREIDDSLLKNDHLSAELTKVRQLYHTPISSDSGRKR
uniref:Mannitol 1-phosphate dehydrogenase n=1 Tax=Ganoderma boninense TaxID=34458 RepID=A0A5K1JZ32_9APHY|nr:Mannitol 1-phosphate dehydrogenase [Ganoderma boninense]